MKQNITLGNKEIGLLSRLEHDNNTIFTTQQAQKILFDTSPQVIRNMLSKLVKKNRIERIKKGTYLLIPFKQAVWAEHELSLVSILCKNGYVSFDSALSFWGLTERLGNRVAVAVNKHTREKMFQETRYQFIELTERYFFGFKTIKIGDREINIATKEKTLLDCLLFPNHCAGIGEIAKVILHYSDDLNWRKIRSYLKKMQNSALERRLKYILFFLGLEHELSILGDNDYRGYRLLDPQGTNTGKYIRKYGLRINIDLEEEML